MVYRDHIAKAIEAPTAALLNKEAELIKAQLPFYYN